MGYLPNNNNSLVGDLAFVLTLLILVANVRVTATVLTPEAVLTPETEMGAGPGTKERSVVATGMGRRIVTTSIAFIRVGVEDQQPTAIGVQRSVANKTTKLLAYLRGPEAAASKLQTTGISLQPQMDYAKKPPAVKGYEATNTVSFEVPIVTSGQVLDKAVRTGATRIIGVEFRATKEVSQDARLDAVEDAVEHATAEATAAARAAGIELGKATKIQIDDTFHQVGVEQDQLMTAKNHLRTAETTPSTPVVPQDQVIEARVTVTFHAN